MIDFDIKIALSEVRSGKLIGLPTETVYGLASPIDDPDLIKKIFTLKERPFFDPLIIHVASKDAVLPLVKEWPEVCDALVAKYWPGPLTLVLEKTDMVSDLITSGLSTVGVRIPNSPVALEFLRQLNKPVAAPSANLFKKISPTRAEDVSAVFDPKDVFVLDGGPCDVGIESTIVQINKTSVEILRPGLITRNDLLSVVGPFGYDVLDHKGKLANAPGQFKEHYQPEKPLYTVVAKSRKEAEQKMGQSLAFDLDVRWVYLSNQASLAARELYHKLREGCRGKEKICALLLNPNWMKDARWKGIIDRLKRASASFLE